MLVVKYNVGMKPLYQQSTCVPVFYGNLVYKLKKKIAEKPSFPYHQKLKQVAQWAVVAHLRASLKFGNIIFYND